MANQVFRTSIQLTTAIIGGCFLTLVATKAIGVPQFRTDLVATLGNVFCSPESGTLTQKAWAQGVYDAQIEGRTLESFTEQKIDEQILQQKAKDLAKQNYHLGFSFGHCPGGMAWMASMPSPEPATIDSLNRLIWPQKTMDQACKNTSADSALAKGSMTQTHKTSEHLNLPEEDGVMTISCWPKTPDWMGPMVWFMAPTGKGPGTFVPQAELFRSENQDSEKLLAWIQQVRKIFKAKEVALGNESLDRASQLLSVGKTVHHNRTLLKSVNSWLKEDGLQLIGEDRAKAMSARQLAWLLWHSPRHRTLLLDPTASHMSVNLVQDKGESLAVILMAKQITVKVGAKPGGQILR
jgi:hypothetical protein